MSSPAGSKRWLLARTATVLVEYHIKDEKVERQGWRAPPRGTTPRTHTLREGGRPHLIGDGPLLPLLVGEGPLLPQEVARKERAHKKITADFQNVLQIYSRERDDYFARCNHHRSDSSER